MSKFFICIAIILASFNCGSSLYCHVTNLSKLINAREVSHAAQDCDTYLNRSITKFFEEENHEELKKLSTFPTCYTAKVSTNSHIDNFVVKGCVPKGKCEEFVTPTIKREARLQGVKIKKLTCSECDGERCNTLF